MLYLAGTVITFAFSVVFSMAGLGAAFLYVPLFYWLGFPWPRPCLSPCCSTSSA